MIPAIPSFPTLFLFRYQNQIHYYHQLFVLILVAILAECTCYGAIGPKATLNIANAVVAPDGFIRLAIVAEGTTPGPLISGRRGDKFEINVINNLLNDTMLRGTSIHWHGLLQHHTAWADGAAGVTQCPIAPADSFEYRFQTWDKAGTYWYHSHFGTQYCDGLRGPLVIYDPYDPFRYLYDVDDESTVITVSDWYHLPSPSLVPPAASDATLINGKGRYVGGPNIDLAVVSVEQGKRYRFRLVSLSCDPNFIFSIDGHGMTIIEADGELMKPVTVNAIQLFAGQRYSFILHARQNIDNYWIRALTNAPTNTSKLAEGFTNGVNSAILRYVGASISEPSSIQQAVLNILDEVFLSPLVNYGSPGRPFPGGADVSLNLDLGFTGDEFTINGKAWREPTIPVLLQLLSGAKTAQELLPQGSVYTLPRGKIVEVSIPAGIIGGPHPFHLHGHTFWVVRSAGENTYNFDNPVRRDVVSIGETGDNVTIRFDTNNPGPWILHCHIDFHLNAGLAIVFAEAVDSINSTVPLPASWNDLCPAYNTLHKSETLVDIVSRHKKHSRNRRIHL